MRSPLLPPSEPGAPVAPDPINKPAFGLSGVPSDTRDAKSVLNRSGGVGAVLGSAVTVDTVGVAGIAVAATRHNRKHKLFGGVAASGL
jgi:hypothetical protein